jgi:hypothetical protein
MAQYRKDTNQFLPQEKTLFETVMLADQYGNIIGGANPSGMAVDAFGRARVSQPLTLFDSFHRYQDNGKLNTANSAFDSYFIHNANSSSIICNVGTSNGAYVYRESNRVFAYQPGKSLQILQTYVMAPAQTGLRQRYGYFDVNNGIFIEQDGHDLYFVIRNTNGTLQETRVAQADWNIDTLDGTNTGAWTEGPPVQNRNPSGITLDMSKAQIMFLDIEWLGLGTVRCGFVINGRFIHCHSFHHSNILSMPYMGTACLPVRSEIQNTANTSNASNLRIVCTTVISEGGYELRGRPRTAGHEANVAYDLAAAATWYPVACIRLKSDREGAIVIPKDINIGASSSSGSIVKYKVVVGANVSGGLWISGGTDSSVQYNINAASFTGGTDFVSGYVTVTNQASTPVRLGDSIFKYQLERNTFNGTNTVFMIAVQTSKAGDDVVASIDWEEVT